MGYRNRVAIVNNSLSSAKIATLESRVRRVFSESSQLDFNNFKPDDYYNTQQPIVHARTVNAGTTLAYTSP